MSQHELKSQDDKSQDDLTVTIIKMNAFCTKPREWMHMHYCATAVLQQKALTFSSHYLRKGTLACSQYLYMPNSRFWWYVCHLAASGIDSECMDSASYIQLKTPLYVTKCSADEKNRIGFESSQAYHGRGTHNIIDCMRERSWINWVLDQILNLNEEYALTEK